MKKDLILGLGTGRCGTLWLFDYLNGYIENSSHELFKLGWDYEGQFDLTIEPMKTWANNYISCEVGFPILPHIYKLSNFFNIKIIVVQRDKQSTIKSFMNWTNPKHNYWVTKPYNSPYEYDGWDPMFPTFEGYEYRSKEEAISKYYDHYYDDCLKLKDQFSVLWIHTETLDEQKTQENILEFLDIPKNKWEKRICRKNRGPDSQVLDEATIHPTTHDVDHNHVER